VTEFAPRTLTTGGTGTTGVSGHSLALVVSIVVVCGIGAFLFDTTPSRAAGLVPHVGAIEHSDRCNPLDAPEWTAPDSDDRATDSSDDDDDDDDGADAATTVMPLRASDSGQEWRERSVIVIALLSIEDEGHLLRGPPAVQGDAPDADVNDDDDDDRSHAALMASSVPADRRNACLAAVSDINRSLPFTSYGQSLRAPPQ
jgi:hypothetical protein